MTTYLCAICVIGACFGQIAPARPPAVADMSFRVEWCEPRVTCCTPAYVRLCVTPSVDLMKYQRFAALKLIVRPEQPAPGLRVVIPARLSYGPHAVFGPPGAVGGKRGHVGIVPLLFGGGDFVFPRPGRCTLEWDLTIDGEHHARARQVVDVLEAPESLQAEVEAIGKEFYVRGLEPNALRAQRHLEPYYYAPGEPTKRSARVSLGATALGEMMWCSMRFCLPDNGKEPTIEVAKALADGRWEYPAVGYAALAYAAAVQQEARNRYVAKWAGSALAKCLREDPDYLATDHYLALAVEHSDVVLRPRALYRRAKFKYVCMKFDDAKGLIDQADKLDFCPVEYRRLFDELANDVFHARRQGELIIQP